MRECRASPRRVAPTYAGGLGRGILFLIRWTNGAGQARPAGNRRFASKGSAILPDRPDHAAGPADERPGRRYEDPCPPTLSVARVVISTDGYVGADGAGWAFVVHGEGHHVVERGVLPDCPSHYAEWVAVERALGWSERALGGGDELELRTDSALVAKGLARRRPAMSGEAAAKRAACRQALARLALSGVKVNVVRVARTANAEADGEARRVGVGSL